MWLIFTPLKIILPAPYKFSLNGQTLWLSSSRCIFWEDQKVLILSDLHFGKSGHFRKSGIAVPQTIFREDMQRLFSQIHYFNPSQLLIVGDFFHSSLNKEINMFIKWRNDLPNLSIQLVKGNHDILTNKFYADTGITVTDGRLAINTFCFTHDIMIKCENDESRRLYTFSGHIHPGLTINGNGKQSISLPCFYFGKSYAVLPAFSRFTGLTKMKLSPGDTVFAIVEDSVLQIK